MKAVLYVYRRADPVVRFVDDFPDIDWSVVWSPEDVDRELGDADLLVLTNRICTPDLAAVLKRHGGGLLKWVHFVSAGIERGLGMDLAEHLLVSNASGAKAPVISEHALTLLLALGRRLRDMRRAQKEHRWARLDINPLMLSLEGATVCLFGLGGIGREVARKLKAFDARVLAVSRADSAGDPNVDRVFARDRMNEALEQSDAVIVCTNADDSSIHMLGEAQFSVMKTGAYVVNVARGEILDEAALIAALQSGKLGGAGLDVTEVEPPEPGNPLFEMENVILSPHVAGGGSTGYARQKDIFAENLKRFRAGRSLLTDCRPRSVQAEHNAKAAE